MNEGEKIYCRPEHGKLQQAWRAGRKPLAQALACLGIADGSRARFTTQVLTHDYPLAGWRYQGSEQKFSDR